MDDFQKKFLDEATDLINDLEEALLEIEKRPDDIDLIEKIFRVMHSLKGGGSMFGFEEVSEFTHNLENIYDLIRNRRLEINKDILNVTLASVDHIKILLKEGLEDKETLEDHRDLTKKILQIIDDKQIESITSESDKSNKDADDKSFKSYHVFFKPHQDIFKDGTNPLFLIDELYQLGIAKIFAHIDDVPEIEKYDNSLCYTSWDIILSTNRGLEEIKDIFMFVEDNSTLRISQIADYNVLVNEDFNDWLSQYTGKIKNFDPDALKKQAMLIKNNDKSGRESQKIKTKRLENKDAISTIRVSADKIDQLMNLVSELVTTQASLTLYADNSKMHDLVVIAENVENLTRQLRDIAFSISLIPIDSMITRFHRLVRDLSEEFGKDIIFETEGGETELDKTLIQNLTEPIMHIIRNSIDHGIEPPEERVRLGKPAKGKITLKAYYSGANVILTLHDDGRGINPKMIRAKAVNKGLIPEDSTYTDKEYLNMIFLPGLSTAQVITDISGRGVGMDVVKRKINEVRGEVDIESDLGVGTAINIKLPLTLSIIDGLLVKINKTHYVIPLSVVDKIYEAKHEDLVGTFNNMIILDGNQYPFYYLREEFEDMENLPEQEQIILVNYEEARIGLAVDYVVGEYQAVLKPLGRHYRNHDIISGATILGDGTVALVLDTNKIIKQFSYNAIEEIQENIENTDE